MIASDQDTIVAAATAPGEAAIGIVRLSGPNAISFCARHCRNSRPPLEQATDRRLTLFSFYIDESPIDEVMVVVMRAPRSYTGEDTVEIHAHGGPTLINRIVSALEKSGARHAQPGEFTKRAYLNGKLDLTQAEAVLDLIKARSDLSLEAAFFQLRGGLRARFEQIRDQLRHALVLLEAQLDFSDDVQIDREALERTLGASQRAIRAQIDSYRQGKRIRDGVQVTLCGQPNVGKSSLLNALLEEDRSIVTDIPGTTRDTIAESVNIDGVQITLIDTAGLRSTADPIEQEGNRRSALAIDQSDLILRVFDAQHPPSEEDLSFVHAHLPHVLPVLNKQDLGTDPSWHTRLPCPGIEVSAKLRTGLKKLRTEIRSHCLDGEESVEVVTHERHVIHLETSEAAIHRAQATFSEGLPWEIISVEVGESISALDAILGETTPEDTLSSIFSTFCIGK